MSGAEQARPRMVHYRVLLNGRNIPHEFHGHRHLAGFWTTRFVLAHDATDAGSLALSLIQQHPALVDAQVVEGEPSPVVLIDQVELLPPDRTPPTVQPGLAFYLDPDEPPLA